MSYCRSQQSALELNLKLWRHMPYFFCKISSNFCLRFPLSCAINKISVSSHWQKKQPVAMEHDPHSLVASKFFHFDHFDHWSNQNLGQFSLDNFWSMTLQYSCTSSPIIRTAAKENQCDSSRDIGDSLFLHPSLKKIQSLLDSDYHYCDILSQWSTDQLLLQLLRFMLDEFTNKWPVRRGKRCMNM